jgi:hypothetical protein
MVRIDLKELMSTKKNNNNLYLVPSDSRIQLCCCSISQGLAEETCDFGVFAEINIGVEN